MSVIGARLKHPESIKIIQVVHLNSVTLLNQVHVHKFKVVLRRWLLGCMSSFEGPLSTPRHSRGKARGSTRRPGNL